MDLNPNSFRRIVGTLLEVNGRGYWETSDENIEQLKELYQEVEDKIEGVRELSNRLNYTLGWSATSGQVDNFVYEETNETFINDEEMRKRLMDLNPNSFRRIVGTLLEVNGRGYWETSDENIEQLKELYQEVEDKIEGVKE